MEKRRKGVYFSEISGYSISSNLEKCKWKMTIFLPPNSNDSISTIPDHDSMRKRYFIWFFKSDI